MCDALLVQVAHHAGVGDREVRQQRTDAIDGQAVDALVGGHSFRFPRGRQSAHHRVNAAAAGPADRILRRSGLGGLGGFGVGGSTTLTPEAGVERAVVALASAKRSHEPAAYTRNLDANLDVAAQSVNFVTLTSRYSVELPGIEPGSYGIPSRLLRAQSAMPLLGSPGHANQPG